nr:MAG TPA: head to tail adaptor [Caudoviricetes sp.]
MSTFLTQEDLKTHLREEATGLITRGDEAITAAAIDSAIAEMKSYLNDYDLSAIFAATGEDRHPLLLTFAKDIAVYHLINLCNYGSGYERRKERYEQAVAWLKSVQKGFVTPDLPRKASGDGTTGGIYRFTSNPKRGNYF